MPRCSPWPGVWKSVEEAAHNRAARIDGTAEGTQTGERACGGFLENSLTSFRRVARRASVCMQGEPIGGSEN